MPIEEVTLDFAANYLGFHGLSSLENDFRRVQASISGAHGAVNAATGVGLGIGGIAAGVGLTSLDAAMKTQHAAAQAQAAYDIPKQAFSAYRDFIEKNSTSLLTSQENLWAGLGKSMALHFSVQGTEAVVSSAARLNKVLGGDLATTVGNITALIRNFHLTATQTPGALDALTRAMQRSGLGTSFAGPALFRYLGQASGAGFGLDQSLGIASYVSTLGYGPRAMSTFGQVIGRLGQLAADPRYAHLVGAQYGIAGSLANLLGAPNATPAALQKLLGGSMGLTLARDVVSAGPGALSLGNYQGALGGAYGTYANSPAGQADRAKLAFQNLQEALGKGLVPVVTELNKDLSPMFRGFADFANANPTAIANIIKTGLAIGGISLAIRALMPFLNLYNQAMQARGPQEGEAAVATEADATQTRALGAALEPLPPLITSLTEQLTLMNEQMVAAAPETTLIETGVAGIGTAAETSTGLLIPFNAQMTALATESAGMAATLDAEAAGIGAVGANAAAAAPEIGGAGLAGAFSELAIPIAAIVGYLTVLPGLIKDVSGLGPLSWLGNTLEHAGGFAGSLAALAGNMIPPLGMLMSNFASPGGSKYLTGTKSWASGQGGMPFTGGAFGAYGSPESNYQNRNIATEYKYGEGTAASNKARVGWYHSQLGGSGPYMDTDFPATRKGPEYFHFPGSKSATYTFVSDGYDPSLPKGSNYYEIWKDPMGNKFMVWHADPRGVPTITGDPKKDYGPNNQLTPSGWTKLKPGMTVHGGQTVGASGYAGGEYHLCLVTTQQGRSDFMVLTGAQQQAMRKSGAKVTQVDPNAPTGLPAGVISHWSEIQQISAQTGIPPGVIAAYMSLEDPSGSNSAVSSAGALGLMQVMPDRPGGHTRTIGRHTYNLRDPMQNLLAGSLLIQGGEAKYGTDWLSIYENVYNPGIMKTAQGRAQVAQLQGYLNATSGSYTPTGASLPSAATKPKTFAQWASYWTGQESRNTSLLNILDQGNTQNLLKLTGTPRGEAIKLIDAAALDKYMATRATLNDMLPPGPLRHLLMSQAWGNYMDVLRHPFAKYMTTSSVTAAGHVVPVHVVGHCAAEQRNETHHGATAAHTKTIASHAKTQTGYLKDIRDLQRQTLQAIKSGVGTASGKSTVDPSTGLQIDPHFSLHIPFT